MTRTTRLSAIIKCHKGFLDKISLLNSAATEVWKAMIPIIFVLWIYAQCF